MIKIHQFDPVTYPFKLWVAITNKEKVGDGFFYMKTKDRINTSSSLFENSEALTYYVQQVEEPRYRGCLIVFTRRKYVTMKNIAHEATHAVRYFWEYIGEGTTGGEADAYLMGWVASCINEVKNFKNQ